jgi:hypothetical protein
MKKYCPNFCSNIKLNVLVFSISALAFIGWEIIKQCFGLQQAEISTIYSPIWLPAIICLFNMFNSLKIQNKTINTLAACSIFVYCIHENLLIREIVRPEYYSYVFTNHSSTYLLWIALCAIVLFVGAYILSILYKLTLGKLTTYLSIKCENLIYKIWNKLFKKKNDTQ